MGVYNATCVFYGRQITRDEFDFFTRRRLQIKIDLEKNITNDQKLLINQELKLNMLVFLFI